MGGEFLDRVLKLSKGYPAVSAKTDSGEEAGFGFLRAFHPAGTFRRTAEVAYVLLPEHNGRDLGLGMLAHFIEEARVIGIDSLLAKPALQLLFCHGLFGAVGRDYGVRVVALPMARHAQMGEFLFLDRVRVCLTGKAPVANIFDVFPNGHLRQHQ